MKVTWAFGLFLLFLHLNLFFRTATSKRHVDIQEISTILNLLVSKGELSLDAAGSVFGKLNAIANEVTAPQTNGIEKTATVNVTVDGTTHPLSVRSRQPSYIDRAAARFCTTTGVPAGQCVAVRDLLMEVAQSNDLVLNVTTKDSTIKAYISSPPVLQWQFTQQRVYFNVTLPPTDVNVSDLCFHIDFDLEPKHCANGSTLISELSYLPRPSFTRSAFQKGWHAVTVQPESTLFTPDTRFFYVAEPSLNIVSASMLQHQIGGVNNVPSYQIKARLHIADFRLGIDGKCCLLLDWQVVSCTSDQDGTLNKLFSTSRVEDTATIVEETESGLQSEIQVDLEASFVSHKSFNQMDVHSIAFVLISVEHHEKAVAISNNMPVALVALQASDKHPKPSNAMDTDLSSSSFNSIIALQQLRLSEFGLWSQNGEDGILLWIFSELKMLKATTASPRYFVEFGVEDGYECNTRFFREHFGWNGLLMDGSNKNKTINLQQEFITAEGINTLFETHGVPQEIDFLSIDIDFNDFWVLKSILDQGKYTAKVIAVEYNGHVPFNESRTVQYNATQMWDGATDYFGAGAGAFHQLGALHGYRLVYCESHGVNAFLVREDLIQGTIGNDVIESLVQSCSANVNFFGRGLNYPKGIGVDDVWVYPFD